MSLSPSSHPSRELELFRNLSPTGELAQLRRETTLPMKWIAGAPTLKDIQRRHLFTSLSGYKKQIHISFFDRALKVFNELSKRPELEDFLTLPAYRKID